MFCVVVFFCVLINLSLGIPCTFPSNSCSYHLSHRLKDTMLLSAPRKPPVNVYAQWRELQTTEAQLVKTVTLMEMRQREREAVRIFDETSND